MGGVGGRPRRGRFPPQASQQIGKALTGLSVTLEYRVSGCSRREHPIIILIGASPSGGGPGSLRRFLFRRPLPGPILFCSLGASPPEQNVLIFKVLRTLNIHRNN